MTVSTTTSSVSYNGTGSQNTFAYTFRIFEDSDLEVIVKAATGVATTQTLTTDYTVTGAGSENGGNVVFVVSPAIGSTVIIRRNIPNTQLIDYVENDPFPAESHEEGLDRAVMRDQQLQNSITNSIRFPDFETTFDAVLPTAENRANGFLKFNSTGGIQVDTATDIAIATQLQNIDRFSGDGGTTIFSLSVAPGNIANTNIFVDGVYQQKDTYSIAGTALTFTSAPPSGTNNIEVISTEALAGATDADAISYDIGTTGSVSRTMASRLKDLVSVKDFGAKGDAATDDSAAFNSAIAYLATLGGGILYVPTGHYLIQNVFINTPNIWLLAGDGVTYQVNGGGQYIVRVLDSGVGTRITGGTFYGQRPSDVGTSSVSATHSLRIEATDCVVENVFAYAARNDSFNVRHIAASESNPTNLVVRNCYFGDTARNVCSIISGREIYFENCTFQNLGDYTHNVFNTLYLFDTETANTGETLKDIYFEKCNFRSGTQTSQAHTVILSQPDHDDATDDEYRVGFNNCDFDDFDGTGAASATIFVRGPSTGKCKHLFITNCRFGARALTNFGGSGNILDLEECRLENIICGSNNLTFQDTIGANTSVKDIFTKDASGAINIAGNPTTVINAPGEATRLGSDSTAIEFSVDNFTTTNATIDTDGNFNVGTTTNDYSANINANESIAVGDKLEFFVGEKSLTDAVATTVATIDCTVSQASKGGACLIKVTGMVINGLRAATPSGAVQSFETTFVLGSQVGGTSGVSGLTTTYGSYTNVSGTARTFTPNPAITTSLTGQSVDVQINCNFAGTLTDPRAVVNVEIIETAFGNSPTVS